MVAEFVSTPLKIAIIVIVCVLLVVGTLVGVGMVISRNAMANDTGQETVRVEPVVSGPLVEMISVPGEIQPRTKVSISSRVAARIAELPHIQGDTVRRTPPGTTQPSQDQLLVRLDAKDLESALRSAEARSKAQAAQLKVNELRIAAQRAQLNGTKAQLADAQRDMNKKRELAITKDISQSEADTAQAHYEDILAQYLGAQETLKSEEQNLQVLLHQQEASDADIAKARDELAYTVITSPIDGVITKLKAEVGEQVVPGIQGSVGSTIMEVADLSQMLMVARIDEANIAAVKPGQKATVRIQAYRDETFEGTVESVALAKADPTASNSRTTEGANYYEAKILLKTDGRRIPTGLNADADIETNRHSGIRVPSQSVLGRPVDQLPAEAKNAPEIEKDKAFVAIVYRYVNGKAVATPVKPGASDETHTLILSGLKAGDLIISGPYKALDTMTNGQEVKKQDVAPKIPAIMPATLPTTNPATMPATVPSTRPETSSLFILHPSSVILTT